MYSIKEINSIIQKFNLQTHPEGGYYAEIFKSDIAVKTDDDRFKGELRKAGTSIYYLLSGNDFSAFHLLKADEIWNFYEGSPIKIHMINEAGKLTTFLLGNPLINPQATFQVIIPAGNWFSAEVLDKTSFSFVGCIVFPGFEFKDFNMANREKLLAKYPMHSEIIYAFTRSVTVAK
jgi:predicted cupin superfamily sugar epimerase